MTDDYPEPFRSSRHLSCQVGLDSCKTVRRAERIDSVTDWRAESNGDNNKVIFSYTVTTGLGWLMYGQTYFIFFA